MTPILAPIVMALALFAILTPRLFGFALRLTLAFAAMAAVYVVDGQRSHPVFSHSYEKSADVR